MKRIAIFSAVFLILASTFTATAQRKDIIDRSYLTPVRIVWTQGNVSKPEVLLKEDCGQPDMTPVPMCRMKNSASDTASIIIDYGREIHGGLRLNLGTSGNTTNLVRIRFGESVSESCSQSYDRGWLMGFSTNDHAMRDFTMRIPRNGTIEIGSTGFRFVRIDLLDPNAVLDIREASAILRIRDIPYLGSFNCSDDRLNEIWRTGAYTVHLNMQEYVWDGIKRDRLVWFGDMHPEVSTIMTVFGYNDVVDRSIDLATQQYPVPKWINDMSSYSMWYLIIQYDWYMHNGNKDFLEKHRGYITSLIDRINECVDENGADNLSKSRFLDWPASPNEAGVHAGYRALLCMAMADGAKLCDILGDKDHSATALAVKARLEKNVLPHNDLKQAAALMAMAGLMDPSRASEDVILVDGAHRFSTFYGYYMLEALALAGEYQSAIDIIKEFWGGMLDLGATTFWEDFNIDWARNSGRIDEFTPAGKDDIHGDFGDYCYKSFRHSLCHGWASGPTPWMTRHILGVEVLEPGCSKIRVTPHLGNLEWAEGTYPTPYGIISIKHERRPDGSIKSTVNAPRGVKIVK